MSVEDKILNAIKELMRAKTGGYDTAAKVVRIDGNTAYVHIDGGVPETPVSKTIDCKVGDTVRVRLQGGGAHITGNDTAPPTDDAEALISKAIAKVADKNAADAKTKAKTAEAVAGEAMAKIGNSLVTDTIHYLATSQSSGVTTETTGWTTTVQSMTSTNRYLWTYHTYTKASEQTVDTTPVITGVYGERGQQGEQGAQGEPGSQGEDGISVISVQPQYAVNNDDQTTPPESSWSDTLIYDPDNPFIWSRDEITYSDTSVDHSDAICNYVLTDTYANAEAALMVAEATQAHFWVKESGGTLAVPVGAYVTEEEQADYDTNNPLGGAVRMHPNGIDIRRDSDVIAKFTDELARIGLADLARLEMDADSFEFYDIENVEYPVFSIKQDKMYPLMVGTYEYSGSGVSSGTYSFNVYRDSSLASISDSDFYLWLNGELIRYSSVDNPFTFTRTYSSVTGLYTFKVTVNIGQIISEINDGDVLGLMYHAVSDGLFVQIGQYYNVHTIITSAGMVVRDPSKTYTYVNGVIFELERDDDGTSSTIGGRNALYPTKGNSSVAMGAYNAATDTMSIASGIENIVEASSAIAYGSNNTVKNTGANSILFGEKLNAKYVSQLIYGYMNEDDDRYKIVVGNGLKSNNFSVLRNALAFNDNNDTLIGMTRVAFANSSTSAATSTKTVTTTTKATRPFRLEDHALVGVKFTYANTASSVSLNVDSLGAKPAYYNGSRISSSNGAWSAGAEVWFQYSKSDDRFNRINVANLDENEQWDLELWNWLEDFGWDTDCLD